MRKSLLGLKKLVLLLAICSAEVNAGDSSGIDGNVAMALPTATEGTGCGSPPGGGAGLTAFSASGLILSCQSGVWLVNVVNVSGYTFIAVGRSLNGVGTMNGNMFSGTLKCNGDTCGGFGYVNCGNNASCVSSYSAILTHFNFSGYTVGVNNLPVTNATKVW